MFWRRRRSKDSDEFYQAGIGAMEAGDFKQAVHLFRKAAEANPNRSEPHAALGAILLPLMEIDEAIHHFNEVIRLGSPSNETYLNLAIALGNKCRMQEALSYAKKALQGSANPLLIRQATQFTQDIEDGTYIGGPWMCKLPVLDRYSNET
jgi:Flp pilus assembly protein TadD